MKLLIVTQKVNKKDPVLGFFHRWIEEFAASCELVTVICFQEGEHNLPKNVHVFSLSKEKEGRRTNKTSQYIAGFYRHIIGKRNEYDAVFVYMNPVYVVLGGIIWRLLGKRIGLWYAHKSVDMNLRIAALLAHAIFTPSKQTLRLPTPKKHVLGYGIDTELFYPGQNNVDELLILSVGKISAIKGYDTLVKSAELLEEREVPFLIQIAGAPITKGDRLYEEDLHSMVRERGLGSSVVFTGAVSREEVAERLRHTFLFVNTNHTGSLDKAVLEAMSSGIPTLTSNEAFADIFGADANTLLFQDSRELVEKIHYIWRMSQVERGQLTERLRHIIVEKHNMKILIPRILHFLR